MTFLVDRLGHLRRQVDHLRRIRPRVGSAADLEADVGLHNEVMFALFVSADLWERSRGRGWRAM